MLRIHDIVTGWGDLYLPGVGLYADRALLLPEAAVVMDGPIDGYLEWLRSVGIGPETVIRVPDSSPVRSILSDVSLASQIGELARKHGGLQFFDVTEHEENLIEMLDLPPGMFFGPPAKLARQAGNKAELRRLAERLGLRGLFPEYRIVDPTLMAVYPAVHQIFSIARPKFVVLKVPDSASGDGMIRLERTREWPDIVNDFLRKATGEIIIESGYNHWPMSVQWHINSDGCRVVGFSDQLIVNGFTHIGNVISSGELLHVRPEDRSLMTSMTLPLVEYFRAHGYRGVIGFDFMRTIDGGQLLLLECNARVTAMTYALGVADQISEKCSSWSIVMSRLNVGQSIRDFSSLKERLDGLLFNGRSGVLPFNVRCLDLDQPNCAVCCVSGNVARSTELLQLATEATAAD
ncbi:hypothetical protein A2480_01495 [Candidatus Uhrbacteria bacterium RIFOXYC2_FULL_47_19]|uniref:ATP-grasp domain-containing protein n=1 Tax=Candidatus Uhrbacteria bacterium RIFOXYC2_FULL_47_19 TaxID=1802424 RepID=A0A1F7WE61_9BACT|nr:MAG: hypothetical protein A2480_01495 [Candidatus Uhrbacteria bacterium RIFOXYC2_FULL_47_19]HCC21842.1 hypothetical protein [Candidatus Uhrbacteria bacterium]